VEAVDGKAEMNTAAKAQLALGAKPQAKSHTECDVAPEVQADPPRPRPEAKSAVQPQPTTTLGEENPLAPDTKAP
jgi:hypothetical protein